MCKISRKLPDYTLDFFFKYSNILNVICHSSIYKYSKHYILLQCLIIIVSTKFRLSSFWQFANVNEYHFLYIQLINLIKTITLMFNWPERNAQSIYSMTNIHLFSYIPFIRIAIYDISMLREIWSIESNIKLIYDICMVKLFSI